MLDSPEVNAFALPGGYVYVTRGIMAYLDSEAELAGVIGHEIGHVTARHGAQRATRQQSAGLGVLAATVLGAVLEGARRGRRHGPGQPGLAGRGRRLVATYSREQELQADQLGAEYLARNRYDPQQHGRRHRRAQEPGALRRRRGPGRRPGGARPAPTGCRRTPATTSAWPTSASIAAGYQGDYADDGRARYLQAIDGMGFGESRAQGVTRGRNFFHEELGIALTAPQGWRIQNAPQAIAWSTARATPG